MPPAALPVAILLAVGCVCKSRQSQGPTRLDSLERVIAKVIRGVENKEIWRPVLDEEFFPTLSSDRDDQTEDLPLRAPLS